MLNADRESNWTNYDRALAEQRKRHVEQALVCPKCSAANRPGATIIELSEQAGWADCGCCSHHFRYDDGR